jgi:hypothetical protein
MVGTLIVGVVCLAAGFALGRVKNAAKLAAVEGELKKIEGAASADFAAVVASIKSHLHL